MIQAAIDLVQTAGLVISAIAIILLARAVIRLSAAVRRLADEPRLPPADPTDPRYLDWLHAELRREAAHAARPVKGASR